MITKEEIESLGWEFDKETQNTNHFLLFKEPGTLYFIVQYKSSNIILIGEDIGMCQREDIKFKGRILTKSELEFVMKLTMYETI